MRFVYEGPHDLRRIGGSLLRRGVPTDLDGDDAAEAQRIADRSRRVRRVDPPMRPHVDPGAAGEEDMTDGA